MDKEVVFGKEISVNYRQKTDAYLSTSPSRDQFKYSTEDSSTGTSTCSSRDSSTSPPEERTSLPLENTLNCNKFHFPPPPVICEQNFPSFLKDEKPTYLPNRHCPDSSKFYSSTSDLERLKDPMDWSNSRNFNPPNNKCPDMSAFSPFRKEQEQCLKSKYLQRNVGRVSPFFMQDCDSKTSKACLPPILNDGAVNRLNYHLDTTTNGFSTLANSGFRNFSQTIPAPFSDIHRMSDPLSYTSQWNGNCFPIDSVQLSRASDGFSSVELQVSNLDPTFEVNEMKKILLTIFSEHVMVLHISMSLQPDGSAKATIKVPSLQDAQYAISRLHRKKIGHKRILISHTFSEKSPPLFVLKSETIALLNDIPSKSLPLIKFRELYEKRYHRPIAVSELYKMKDVVIIQGDSGSRMVFLNLDYCKTPSLPDSEDSQEMNGIERPYCERHFHVSVSEGWAEQYSICPLPLVHISLKVLSTAVHRLLDTHQGSVPLISFCDCYEAEIGPLPIVGTFDTQVKEESAETSKEQRGVPLEHLIACVNGVEVAKSALCIKKVQWLENRIMDIQVSQSPALAGQLTLFGREVIDLLKSQPQCLVPFNKFIPTYHHHFGRQCRVADYGFTKLIDLLEAISHIVQVLDEGQNRQVTLTHRTQVKRFSAELLRILKSRASKQITIAEFSQAYEQVIGKSFEVTNYGVCEIEDMLEEVSENVIVICSSGDETIIGIPKREQTVEEIERTKQFASEVIELMKHTPCCTMAFNKFIPAYHHHFEKQCRVADYGFTKLIELFEAIPYILEVTGMGEDKVLHLVPKEQHKILTQRLVSVLKSQVNEVIDINLLSSCYAKIHGHALRPTDFGFTDLHDLVEHMDALRIVIGYVRTYVTLVDEKVIHQISLNIRRLLMEQLTGKMRIAELCENYENRYGHKINPSLLLKDMTKFVQVEDSFVVLTPVQMLARQIVVLLHKEEGKLDYVLFRHTFQSYFGGQINTKSYGFPNLNSLFEHLSDYFSVVGKKMKRIICFNTTALGVLSSPLPDYITLALLKSESKEKLRDLMGFETPPLEDGENYEDFIKESKVLEEPSDIALSSLNSNQSQPISKISRTYDTNSTLAASVISPCKDHFIQTSSTKFSEFITSSASYSQALSTDSLSNLESDLDSLEHSDRSLSESIPVRSSRHRSRRNRIAANFSMLIE